MTDIRYNKKPLYTVTWLCNKSVSEENQTLGKNAGYFFYETSEGFFFKSVDGLLGQEPKLKLIYNETPDVNGNIPEVQLKKVARELKEKLLDNGDRWENVLEANIKADNIHR